jgi:hypothetical protein
MKESSFPPVKLGRTPKSMVDFLLFCPSYRYARHRKMVAEIRPKVDFSEFLDGEDR